VPSENLDFDLLAKVTEGYSGADIKLICDEAKHEMFRREISGDEELLKVDLVVKIINKTPPSINEKMLKKYEEFGKF